MSRRYATTYRRASTYEARAASKIAAAEAAGIPVRTDADCREPILLDLSRVGGFALVIEPRRGHLLQWRARDEQTGEVVAHGALKTVLHAIADALPRARVMDD